MGRDGRTSRATINFWVDVVIGLSFLVSAITGIVKYLPADWFAGAGPFGVRYPLWTAVHDWGGFVMVAGIFVHAALHWRWIVATTRRTFLPGSPRATRARSSRPAPSAARFDPGAAGSAAPSRTTAVATSRGTAAVDGGTHRSAQLPARAAGNDSRFTRRRLLAGAAVIVAGVVVGGAVSRAVAESDVLRATTDDQTSAREDETGSASGGASTSSSSGAGSGTDATIASARVTVDSSRCTACGRCLSVCPAGVFAASSDGRYAVAQTPDACRLCGRCVQVCPAGAITVNG